MLTTRLHKNIQFTFALPFFVSFRLSDFFRLCFHLHLGLTLKTNKQTNEQKSQYKESSSPEDLILKKLPSISAMISDYT